MKSCKTAHSCVVIGPVLFGVVSGHTECGNMCG